MAICEAWAEPRAILIRELQGELELGYVIYDMATNKTSWKAITAFAEVVFTAKIAAENERQRVRRQVETRINAGT